jgi:hypothetical protein
MEERELGELEAAVILPSNDRCFHVERLYLLEPDSSPDLPVLSAAIVKRRSDSERRRGGVKLQWAGIFTRRTP